MSTMLLAGALAATPTFGLSVPFSIPTYHASVRFGLVGGPITRIIPCAGGLKYLTVGGPMGGNFIYVPPQVYRETEPNRIDQLVLGLTEAPTVCSVGKSTYVAPKISVIHGTSF